MGDANDGQLPRTELPRQPPESGWTDPFDALARRLTAVESRLSKLEAAAENSAWRMHNCDGQGCKDPKGFRFHCNQCQDVDFCHSCLTKSNHPKWHTFTTYQTAPETPPPQPRTQAPHRGWQQQHQSPPPQGVGVGVGVSRGVGVGATLMSHGAHAAAPVPAAGYPETGVHHVAYQLQ